MAQKKVETDRRLQPVVSRKVLKQLLEFMKSLQNLEMQRLVRWFMRKMPHVVDLDEEGRL